MIKITFSVEYYEENGKYPVVDFIQGLSQKEQAKILREIDLLEQFGFSLGMPYIKRFEGTYELWELRIKHGTNNFRIFYFHYENGLFIMLHSILKKTGKTPSRDIDLAVDRIKKYRERYSDKS